MARVRWVHRSARRGAHPCPGCEHLDQKVFDSELGPKPPLHPNCDCELEEVGEDDPEGVAHLPGPLAIDWEKATDEALVAVFRWLLWITVLGLPLPVWLPLWVVQKFEEWRREGEVGKAVQPMKMFQGPTVVKALDGAGLYEAMVTTEAEDRAGDIIVAAGGRFDAYMKNPVVLFAHDHTRPPVAKALDVRSVAGGVVATFQFPEPGVSAFADEIHGLWRGGFLNAVSLGAAPEAWQPNGARGKKYVAWEMVEFSIVPVPANRETLRRGLSLVGGDEDGEEAALALLRQLKEIWS